MSLGNSNDHKNINAHIANVKFFPVKFISHVARLLFTTSILYCILKNVLKILHNCISLKEVLAKVEKYHTDKYVS